MRAETDESSRGHPMSDDGRKTAEMRRRMVDTQLRARGIANERVLEAIRTVPRHAFMRPDDVDRAYDDRPLPIGYGQTISQPYMVAIMTAALEPGPADHVLEVGTGSGYQAAVLASLVAHVVTIEWVPELAERARETLACLGYENVDVRVGDGSLGTPGGEYQGIVVTAGGPDIPHELREQLADGGRLVIPVGTRWHQELTVIRRHGVHFEEDRREGCVFVPLQGKHGW